MREVDRYKLFALSLKDEDGYPIDINGNPSTYYLAKEVQAVLGRVWGTIGDLAKNSTWTLNSPSYTNHPHPASVVSLEKSVARALSLEHHPGFIDKNLNPRGFRLAILTKKEYETIMAARK